MFPLTIFPSRTLQAALESTDVTVAALAATIAFHALTTGQIRDLHLPDVRDGRLHLGDRVIPLAMPVHHRLRSYLDYRTQRWPNTANPHLFVHYRTAMHTGPVTVWWIARQLGMSPQLVRQDRSMNEAHATHGDARLVCDLFGLSVAGAYRYTSTVDHPGTADFENNIR